uniref:Ovule protein n=1 Tax=Toxocara canis TaxID=6265 RepID=A0A183U9R3_TOXCA
LQEPIKLIRGLYSRRRVVVSTVKSLLSVIISVVCCFTSRSRKFVCTLRSLAIPAQFRPIRVLFARVVRRK